jgi:hypothetical protein
MYRAEPVTQRDGSSLANSNCLMAAAAVGLDFHTLGDKTSTGAKMRSYSGDTSGGTNTDEIERAWKNGYSEDPVTRDGNPWSKVLEDLAAKRLVMLQVWHATVGGPCLSGSGAYGHGMCVAPESRTSDGNKEWLVADPWCNPPKWSWVRESKLKAGAEKWVATARAAANVSGPTWPLIIAAAIRLMERFGPDHPATFELPEVGGPGVLFASTKPQPGADDVAINTNGSRIVTARRVKLTAEAGFYKEASLDTKYGTLASGSVREFIGPALGENSMAILVNTSKPYSDGTDRPTIVYVTKDKCGEPYQVEDDVIKARDAEWRAWLSGDADAPDK